MAIDKSMNVLVVDDYKTMTRIIRGLLEQLGFSNIDDALDGPTALERIRQKDYGLILSDWNMSPMTGFDLLKAVRAEPRTQSMRNSVIVGASFAGWWAPISADGGQAGA